MRQLLFFLFIFSFFNTTAQKIPDAIVGRWLKTPKEDLVIRVYKTGNEYRGKVIQEKDLAKKQAIGFVILENLHYDNDKQVWTDGKIHDPMSGKTYDAEATINRDGTLEVKCYMGMKFIGTKKYFKRVK